MKDKPKMSEEKQPLRAPSGVYGQRVHPSRSPDEGMGSFCGLFILSSFTVVVAVREVN